MGTKHSVYIKVPGGARLEFFVGDIYTSLLQYNSGKKIYIYLVANVVQPRRINRGFNIFIRASGFKEYLIKHS